MSSIKAIDSVYMKLFWLMVKKRKKIDALVWMINDGSLRNLKETWKRYDKRIKKKA